MSKILVTGGRGFIGTNLTNELRRRGHDVVTCDIIHGEDPQHIRADVSSFWQMEQIFKKHSFEFVYHLAAEYGRWNGEDHFSNLWQTNVVGTKNILRLQEEYGFKHIFFSSCEVYGDYDGIMSEDVMERIPIVQMNDYAISKWAGEMQVLNSALMFNTETVRVRPLNCYGPHEYYSSYRGVIPIFVYRALHDVPYTVYEGHKRIFDYVDDTVRTVANIVDNFIPGEVYNVGGKEEWIVDIKFLSDLVLKTLGKSDKIVEYKPSEPFTTRIKQVDFTKIRRDLDHAPQWPIEKGIVSYVEWMKKVYNFN
ncbi:NAD-dependent epimerase/dehydratase family protein [Maridesulfovibrio zosterae]|uniref:NAD-dependent epimerase/dehydratase family protein n=1 Tax=Maridesulfovibrio zosterae TaxID=82171 RepID=UPI00040A45D5|nr:NAD(P)-dependent oxidoreductase [Maridesulfovibrio zosterae]